MCSFHTHKRQGVHVIGENVETWRGGGKPEHRSSIEMADSRNSSFD